MRSDRDECWHCCYALMDGPVAREAISLHLQSTSKRFVDLHQRPELKALLLTISAEHLATRKSGPEFFANPVAGMVSIP
jgi:hypothetical protein